MYEYLIDTWDHINLNPAQFYNGSMQRRRIYSHHTTTCMPQIDIHISHKSQEHSATLLLLSHLRQNTHMSTSTSAQVMLTAPRSVKRWMYGVSTGLSSSWARCAHTWSGKSAWKFEVKTAAQVAQLTYLNRTQDAVNAPRSTLAYTAASYSLSASKCC
jgi:hypothetical protein